MAVHALLFVAVMSPSQRVTSALVAQSSGTSAAVIRNIFLDLSRCGMIIASAGKNGGVRLGREPKDITLWEIYEAVETNEVEEIFKMYKGNCQCPIGKNFYQILYPHMESAMDAMKADMETVTIETLMSELQAVLQNSFEEENIDDEKNQYLREG